MTAAYDLAQLLVPRQGEDYRVGQGTIVAWDPDSFQNQVSYDGLLLDDVPVASGVEALTYRQGDVVLLEQWFPGGKAGELGAGSIWIKGRVVIPGDGRAEEAVAFMRGTLAKQIAAEVFAERVKAESIAGVGTRSGAIDFGQLSGVDPLVVTDVDISAAGKMVVILGAKITANPTGGDEGRMSVRVTGATTLPPEDGQSYTNALSGDDTLFLVSNVRAVYVRVFEGLNPGLHTVAAEYKSPSGEAVLFADPTLTVIAL